MIIMTVQQLNDMIHHYLGKNEFAFDVETIGEDRGDALVATVAWISFACDDREDTIPLGHPHGELLSSSPTVLASGQKKLDAGKPLESLRPSDFSRVKVTRTWGPAPSQLPRGLVFPALKPLFFSNALKIGHNIKFDLHAVKKYLGAYPDGPYYDTMIASWVLDVSLSGRLSLDQCVARELGTVLPKGIGKDISLHSFSEVAGYSTDDARATYDVKRHLDLRYAAAPPSQSVVLGLEMSVLYPVLEMEATGVRVDKVRLSEIDAELREGIDTLRGLIWVQAGYKFNLNSNKEKQQLLFGPKPHGMNLRPLKRTEGAQDKHEGDLTIHDYAVDHETLVYHRAGHPIIQMMLAYAQKMKIHGTYVLPYLGGDTIVAEGEKPKHVESRLRSQRIHGTFKQNGAESGRFSCVAGDTRLETSRGAFRFDEYVPIEGDLVRTHGGRWMPVLRKIYKGIALMYSVRSEAGDKLTCTADHRLLTPEGWKRVGDLQEGDVVVRVEDLGRDTRPGSREEVQGRRQAHVGWVGGGSGDHYAERGGGGPIRLDRRGVSGGEGTAVLTVEDGILEPYAGQEWFPAPRLQGVGTGRSWVPDRAEGRWPGVPASSGGGCRTGGPGTAGVSTRSPHRWGQDEQCDGQPRAGDPCWAPETAPNEARIESITFVAPMGVWDIEVGGDHSYAAHGFLSHNSSNPNLQNVPSRSAEGKKLRGVFIADPGTTLVVADWSQIEPRIIASLSGDKTMIATYRDGGDVYQVVGDQVGVVRSTGKELVLSIAYGIGPNTISSRIGCTTKEAQELMEFFASRFPAIRQHRSRVIARAKVNRYSSTILGRRRLLPQITWSDPAARAAAERQAYNHVIQGSAADIMKIALVNIHAELPLEARMLMTVHDEVVVQSPFALERKVIDVVRYEMENAAPPRHITVPLVADVASGRTWAEGKG